MASANAKIGENGLFRKALNALNVRPSMQKGKNKVVNGMTEKIGRNTEKVGLFEDFAKANKENINKTDEVIDARRRIKNIEDTNAKLQGKVDSIAEKGFNGANPLDKAKMIGSGIADYYNPLSDQSVATKALRYGATAGAVSAGAVGARYISGGTMTEDKDGNKDIAGVPFL